MDYSLWFALFCGIIVKTCGATATIELRLVRYDVTNGSISSDGKCCDSGLLTKCPLNECDPYIYICIQDVRHVSGCQFGSTTTGYTDNNDHVQFTNTIGNTRTPNPIIFHIAEYGGVIIPKVTAYDEDKSSGAAQDDKIDYMQYVHSQPADHNNSREHVYPIKMQGQFSTLKVELNVRCDENFYGSDCKRYCIPDSESYCNNAGKLVCRSGAACDPNRPMSPKPQTSTVKTTIMTSTPPASSSPTMSSSRSSISSVASFSTSKRSSRSVTTASTSTAMKSTHAPVAVATTSSPRQPTVSVSPAPVAVSTTMNPTISSTTGLTCYFNQSAGSNTGGVRVSVPTGSDIRLLQSQMISRLALTLNLDIPSLYTNASFVMDAGNASVYEIYVYNRSAHQVINTTRFSQVVIEFCGTERSGLLGDEVSPDGGGMGKTAIIAGVVSAALLVAGLAPFLVFLYKRKCRSSRVVDGNAEKTIT